jgi:putative serine protease PepD
VSTEHENMPTGADGSAEPDAGRTAQLPAVSAGAEGTPATPPPPAEPPAVTPPAVTPPVTPPPVNQPPMAQPPVAGPPVTQPPVTPPPPPAAQAPAGPEGAPGPHGPHVPPAPTAHPTFGAGTPMDATPGGAPPAYGGWPQTTFSGPPERKKGRGGLVALVAAAALVAGAIGGSVGYLAADKSDSTTGSTTVSSSADPAALNRKPDSVAGIANRALPSVVTINATGSQESDTGTGFVYDRQGHILTNNHVVASAANGGNLTVTFSNGKTYRASVVGHAQGYDVAVIKIDHPGNAKLVPLTLGDSSAVAVGDATVAIGAPFGLSGTVTTGIVSAKDRPVAAGGEDGSQPSYMSAIQTDASINPGNSGGPLLDASGHVIGINSAIQNGDSGGDNPFGGGGQSGSVGLGFAIPINQAKWVAQTLIKSGEPVYAVLSVLRNDSYNGKGAQISPQDNNGTPAVTPGGPAAKAGLKPGDVITKLDNTMIESGPQLVSEIWTHHPGDKVKVTYERSGEQHTTTVTLGERKGDSG